MKKKVYVTKDILKLEVAEELGLTHKIKELGWGELTAEETGRIGGIMTRKIKEFDWK
ncbi:Small, acid-soluble spore protein, alpha/beta type [Desulfonispora thiosulfatigenes DSM 11270]|uniref:Small, acid-soluble spore protein, alpha/beta type n=1 Tax=Desulfonispora thiosulfatigenes DSM 11270 TaxID=656914 RepID=A0A1W1UQY1_DESTI|nr:small, acid-soluble spore protein, alpha/beta type [Desulfonispora thiosulfatigenes]SMB83104.1 Small, acid-soluble spore protein, alpha/beta type [Desulfonispora thiosulfatigenes DSM 11270]